MVVLGLVFPLSVQAASLWQETPPPANNGLVLEAATPTPTPQAPPFLPSAYTSEAVGLTAGVLILLFIIFVLLILWSHKLDQASYLGSLYRDTVEEIEYKRLASRPIERWRNGDYYREVLEDGEWCRENDVDTDLLMELVKEYTWGASISGSGYGTGSWGDTDPYATWDEQSEAERLGSQTSDTMQQKSGLYRNETQEKQEKREKYRRIKQKLEIEARLRYRRDLDECRKKARERAKDAVSIDLATLRGRGAEFVLEFTTVVVIIFAAVVLGILRVLDAQQIGTLLAAIAGYVLGRATTRSRSETGATTETRTAVNLEDLAKLIAASRGGEKPPEEKTNTPLQTPPPPVQDKTNTPPQSPPPPGQDKTSASSSPVAPNPQDKGGSAPRGSSSTNEPCWPEHTGYEG